ncbi:MFS transporter [Streptomyces sp. NRRL S-340]|uniref:MFS transporter n=1 Tax=Streptomyces sp. NRRL S-340 TaxID=1463901 RepID=UPI000569005C|nr:MFS transporter [Streptomyces sp. NRRL S-340]
MERALRVARFTTFVYFILNGTLLGMWVVEIPTIENRVGISHAALGGFLVLLGVGAFTGMQLGGRLSDRLGTRTVVPLAGVLCSVTLVLPGLAGEPWVLGAALLAFGFGNGTLDVSMNAHAVQVETAYRRPVMSAFHATFSVGGVLAALAGAAAIGIGWGTAVTLAVTAGIGTVVALAAARGLLPSAPDTPAADGEAQGGKRAVPGRIWLLAVLALLIMLCEGAANDWSVLHLKTVLGASRSTAAFAYGTFAATMTIGRLLADRVSARFGPVAVLRHGAALAATGITLVALTPWIWAALTGWALFGLGLSGCIPQLFSAAGHLDPTAAGTNVSRVAGLGYVGMLAGPAVIGWMTHLMALNHTFLLPALFCATAVAAAGILRAPAPSGRPHAVEPSC